MVFFAFALYPIAVDFSPVASVFSVLSIAESPLPPPIAIAFAAVADALRPSAVALPPVATARKPIAASPHLLYALIVAALSSNGPHY